ncbi:hypothetical protein AB3X91_37860 [Paraburkholderia sp. BR14263]|uniref:hypothetical protein n=1 Tax=unclassified Paraburkholderia TaxID=2615204 RepID=UPI0034CFC07E
MNSYVRVRACPDPNNFFDELIPETGLVTCGWRLTTHRIPVPVYSPQSDKDGKVTFVDTTWLHAESDCEEGELARFRQDKLPVLLQLVQALGGYRQTYLAGSVRFSMFYEEFVKDGVSSNIEPHKINIGVDILNFRVNDGNGNITFDAQQDSAEKARRALQDTRDRLRAASASFSKNLDDDFFRRAWESFNLAFGADEHAISHLYDVRDAVSEKFDQEGQSACKALGLKKAEWTDFGKVFNDGSVKGGRHNGQHPAPMRPMSDQQREKVIRFARTILSAYRDYLDNQAANDAKPAS